MFGLAITVNVNCLSQTIQQTAITACMLRCSLLIRLFSDDGVMLKIFLINYRCGFIFIINCYVFQLFSIQLAHQHTLG